jgi:large subunit ribosomal protein L31
MKKETHPEYRDTIFLDDSSGARFLIGSTMVSKETDKWEDGKEYPVIHVEISSASHPFYTGQEKVLDTAGRVEKFKARQKAATGGSHKAKKQISKASKVDKEPKADK